VGRRVSAPSPAGGSGQVTEPLGASLPQPVKPGRDASQSWGGPSRKWQDSYWGPRGWLLCLLGLCALHVIFLDLLVNFCTYLLYSLHIHLLACLVLRHSHSTYLQMCVSICLPICVLIHPSACLPLLHPECCFDGGPRPSGCVSHHPFRSSSRGWRWSWRALGPTGWPWRRSWRTLTCC
jgi:hypothetical protein